MKKNLFFAAFASAVLLSSCGGTSTPKEDNKIKQPEKTSEVCSYMYDHSKSTLKWTAYKTTEKIGVSGTFDNINIANTTTSENALDVLQNAEFKIPIESVNTSNEDRDGKIAKYFFGTMMETENISGKLKALNADGNCVLSIRMNGVEKDVEGTYSLEGQAFSMSAVLDLANWNGDNAVKALNEVCNDLHKGADGVSKLWPEVKIEVNTTLNKECK